MVEARTLILERLRQGRAEAPFATTQPELPPVVEAACHPTSCPAEAWQTMAAALEPVNGTLLLAGDPAEAATLLREILAREGVHSAVRWAHPLPELLGVDALLAEAGVRQVPLPVAGERHSPLCPELEAVDLGITAVDAVFALAGTLVLCSGEGRPRAVSLVPPLHLALAPQSLLYDDLASLPELLRNWRAGQGSLPDAVTLITGSSSTADIEQTLVRPAHGPRRVYVLGLTWL